MLEIVWKNASEILHKKIFWDFLFLNIIKAKLIKLFVVKFIFIIPTVIYIWKNIFFFLKFFMVDIYCFFDNFSLWQKLLLLRKFRTKIFISSIFDQIRKILRLIIWSISPQLSVKSFIKNHSKYFLGRISDNFLDQFLTIFWSIFWSIFEHLWWLFWQIFDKFLANFRPSFEFQRKKTCQIEKIDVFLNFKVIKDTTGLFTPEWQTNGLNWI
mgnify:CR=1 FL=1